MKHGEFFLPCFISCEFSGNPRFARGFGLLKMIIFGHEDNMVGRFVEIDACVFLDGTLTLRQGFQLTSPGTRNLNLGFPGNLHVFTEGLTDQPGKKK